MRTIPVWRSLLGAVGLALLAVTAPSASALALFSTGEHATPADNPSGNGNGIGIRLLDVPVATQTDPRARSYIVDNVAPGTAIQRRVQIQNSTAENQDIRVYAGAARIEGSSFIGEDGAAENELTSWIRVEKPTVNLAPGESTNVMVTISVPEDAAEGERYAAIWAEVRSASSGNVISASRVGVRVYLSVSPGNGPPAAFEITEVSGSRTADGAPQVSASVKNTGGRALDLTGRLSLSSDGSGLSAGPFALDRTTTVAPGEHARVTFTLPDALPEGPWEGIVELTSGLLTHEVKATITFPDAGEAVAVQTEDDSPFAWALLAIGAACVAAIGLAVYLALRRHRKSADARRPELSGMS
ncbi:hypothetical protein [Ruicaihuangia caeni]|uniref:hypothetical protein n=1 Tax=Ruicaihuangia caeni TaxID=3042517 RepID=UPI00338DF3DD